MTHAPLLPHRPPSLYARLLDALKLRKAEPIDDMDHDLATALSRLNDLSPHLLRDLGFRRVTQGDQAVHLWRRGALEIALPNREGR